MDFLLYDFLSFQILRQNIALSDPILDRIIAKSRAQLFAKGRNMDTYGVAEAVDASVPDMLDHFFRAYDTVLMKKEIFQQGGIKMAGEVEKLQELVEKYDFLTARRGMGLMQGIVCEKPVGQVSAKALEEGLILITAGSDVLRIVPPLIIEKEHVDEMVEKLEKVFQKMK